MKTPQEEAEALIGKLAYSMIPMHKNEDPYPVLREREYLTAEIKQSIPLAELIAVARTADKSQKTAAIFNDEDVKLCEALQALRATGKVEL